MRQTLWNDNWKFWEITNSFALNWAPPKDARIVDLPHDAMIERPQAPDAPAGANTGYRKGGIYSYSRSFTPEDPQRTYVLKIEGAYMNAFVYINGQLAAKRPFGYTVFYVPMNDFLEFGKENEIRVQVRSGAEPNSRWYPGTGLYRDVYLLEAGPAYIQPDGVQIRTIRIPSDPSTDDSAAIHISALIHAKAGETAGSLIAEVKNADGTIAAYQEVPAASLTASTVSASSGSTEKSSWTEPEESDRKTYCASLDLSIASPHLWSAETPYLYECQLLLKAADGTILDQHTDRFGIRTLSLSPTEGLQINGMETKLRGTCIHHDAGILGARTYKEVELRRIRKLKDAGYNAIRSAHHPASPALLQVCDQVGMYVMDESFDMWTRHKSDYDYGMYFDEWWEADIEAMVKNSFNHPSVLMYSIGNEIPEIGTKLGGRISKKIAEKIRSLDDTRFTLASVNGLFAVGDDLGKVVADTAADLSAQGKFEGNVNDFMSFMHSHMGEMTSHPIVDQVIAVPTQYTDIAGYNYMEGRYELDGQLHPDRVIVGSETGIASIHHNWPLVKKLPYLIGDFSWTGWDYLGEAGIGAVKYSGAANPFSDTTYPMQTAQTGDFDITGYRLPMSYYRQIIFGLRKDPYIAVQDPAHYGEPLITNPWVISNAIGSWSWSKYEGKPVVIEVYSDSEEVELLKNDESLGRKPAGEAEGYRIFFETTYEPGSLTAISYTNGQETGRFSLQSAAKELQLSITREPGAAAPGSDASQKEDSGASLFQMNDPKDLFTTQDSCQRDYEIQFYSVEICDRNGIVEVDQDTTLRITVEGNAEILGFGSGDPKPSYNYNEQITTTYRGRAQLILKVPADGHGEISILAETGLRSAAEF